MAEFHGVQWLNLNQLAKSLRPELMIGEVVGLELSKPGKEEGQAVGYLEDGSMVVVVDGRAQLGRRVEAEVTSILPSPRVWAKMMFTHARPLPNTCPPWHSGQ